MASEPYIIGEEEERVFRRLKLHPEMIEALFKTTLPHVLMLVNLEILKRGIILLHDEGDPMLAGQLKGLFDEPMVKACKLLKIAAGAKPAPQEEDSEIVQAWPCPEEDPDEPPSEAEPT